MTTVYSTIQMTATYTQPVRYLLTPPDYNNQTGHFSLFQDEVVFHPIQFGDWEEYACLYYDYFLLNATAGQEIRGRFEVVKSRFEAVNRAVDFFILNLNQLRAFKGSRCGNWGDWTSQVHVSASSYDLDWVPPQSGEYALLFLSRDSYFYYNFYGSYLTFMAKVYSPTTLSSSVTFTSTRIYTLQSSQIVISTQPNINPASSTNYYFIALVVLVVIGSVILITLRMKRQTQS